MSEMMSYCGLLCHECDTYLATKADDDSRRAEIAQKWSKEFDANLSPADINCDGCLSEGGRLFNYCLSCEIRLCARERGLSSCARCEDYGCDKLAPMFKMVPDAQKRLDRLRATR